LENSRKSNKKGTLLRLPKIPRRRFLQASAAAGLGVGLYTWRWESHWLELVQRPLPIARLPEHWIGSRIVQVSDLHIGADVNDGYLIRTFEHVKELSPEIVVYTGDFISFDAS